MLLEHQLTLGPSGWRCGAAARSLRLARPGEASEATSWEASRRILWSCSATSTIFYSNFTTFLRCLYDSGQYP